MSQPLFLPTNKHRFSAAETRTIPRREATPDIWTVNLAQHVSVQRSSPWQPLGVLLLCFFCSVGLGLALSDCEQLPAPALGAR